MTINNVAICYYGMTRSLKFVYKSHEQFLFNTLKNNHIRYEIFMHTWDTGKYNIIGKTISDKEINYEDYKVLNVNHYRIDVQSEFINNINMDDYFDNDLFINIGENPKGEWNPKLIMNHICSLESIKRVTMMVESYNTTIVDNINKFDAIIYIRPDIELCNEFSLDWFSYFNLGQIILLNYDHNNGYNDKFAIVHGDNYKAYGNRIDKLKEYRKKMGRITPEKFVKYIVLRNYNQIKFIDLEVKIIRPFNLQYFGDENIDSIDFNNLILSYNGVEAYFNLVKEVFSIPENQCISIINNIYQIYKNDSWINSNWKDISFYLYNKYIFYLKSNFEKIKYKLDINKIINYNKFFFIGYNNIIINDINNQLIDFFTNKN